MCNTHRYTYKIERTTTDDGEYTAYTILPYTRRIKIYLVYVLCVILLLFFSAFLSFCFFLGKVKCVKHARE